MRGDVSRPFGVLGIWDTRGICIGRSAARDLETQGGFERLVDAHSDRSQWEIHVADCVLLGTSAPQLGAFAPRGIEFSRQRNVAQGVDDES